MVAGKEDRETLLGTGRVRLPEDLDDLGVREPLGDFPSTAESGAELGAGDVEGADALGDLVDGGVLVAVGEVGHHLEGDDLDAELVAVLFDGVLGVVGAVEVDPLGVLAGAGVVTADDEVRGAVVLADDGVPDGLAGAAHAHGEGEEAEDGHAVGVSGEEGLVDTDTGEVVDVAGLGEADDGVDEDVGVVRAGGADGEFPVGAVHRVTGLESDNLGPAELVEVSAELSRSVFFHTMSARFSPPFLAPSCQLTSQLDKVIMLQLVDSLKLSTDIKLLGGVVKVLNSRMLLITAENLLSLELPIFY